MTSLKATMAVIKTIKRKVKNVAIPFRKLVILLLTFEALIAIVTYDLMAISNWWLIPMFIVSGMFAILAD